MDRGLDIPWVGGHITMGKGITILKVEFQFVFTVIMSYTVKRAIMASY